MAHQMSGLIEGLGDRGSGPLCEAARLPEADDLVRRPEPGISPDIRLRCAVGAHSNRPRRAALDCGAELAGETEMLHDDVAGACAAVAPKEDAGKGAVSPPSWCTAEIQRFFNSMTPPTSKMTQGHA
jgi:hypothetical protein